MRPNIHRVNLAPVVTEQDLIIKEAEVNKKLQEKNINVTHNTDDDLEVLGEFVKMSMKEVVDDPTSQIFSHRASKAEMAKGREDMGPYCTICRTEFGKKNKLMQCEFCARNCCSQCCFKSRLDPQAKNASTAQKLLICEECEDKYRNVILNQEFRKQHLVFSRLKDQLVGEISKIQQKCSKEKTRIESMKPKEDPQVVLSRTMKLAKLKKEVQNGKKENQKLAKDVESEKVATPKLLEKVKVKADDIKKKKEHDEKVRLEKQKKEKQAEEARARDEQKRKDEESRKQEDVSLTQNSNENEVQKTAPESADAKKMEIDEITEPKPEKNEPHKVQSPVMVTEVINVQAPVEKEYIAESLKQSQPKLESKSVQKTPEKDINTEVIAIPQKIAEPETKQQQPQTKPTAQTPKQPSLPNPPQIDPFDDIQKTELQSPLRNTRVGSNYEVVKDDIKNQAGKYANVNINPLQKPEPKKQPEPEQVKVPPPIVPEPPITAKTKEIRHMFEQIEPAPKKQQPKKLQAPVTPAAPAQRKSTQSQSRANSEYSPSNPKHKAQNNFRGNGQIRPASMIMDGQDNQDALMTKSAIFESESKQPRKSSKQMTEKEILSLKIPPPTKAHKLFKEAEVDTSRERAPSRGKINSSVKQSVTEQPKATTPSQRQLSKEQILRKSRNEDLEESQTPGVDQKSKCSCLLF